MAHPVNQDGVGKASLGAASESDDSDARLDALLTHLFGTTARELSNAVRSAHGMSGQSGIGHVPAY